MTAETVIVIMLLIAQAISFRLHDKTRKIVDLQQREIKKQRSDIERLTEVAAKHQRWLDSIYD